MYEIEIKEMWGRGYLKEFVSLKRSDEDSITFLKEGNRTYYILIENKYEERIDLHVVDDGELYRSVELTSEDIDRLIEISDFDWDLMSRADIAELIDRLDVGKHISY